ncbi:MAG: bifunctional glutamate N-acetyltransferase/amino-acid acetyltransferase ArgJ [Syntrophales bacterium]|nr:bifunctional glutamate N-acetyltransferase/amino-acid acetyltransferase ArgJ [Syntrophales bacterium]
MACGGDVYAVPGFMAAGVEAGIKSSGQRDLALIFAEIPARTVGVFTTNDFKAAPVLLSQERIKKGTVRAILVNSGNANAATGDEGYHDACLITDKLAELLKVPADEVLMASTGVIGQRMPVGKVEAALPYLVRSLSVDGIGEAAEAIMTTDRFPKISFRRVLVGGNEVSICGIAKGAGMIEPSMATMLSFTLTDAVIDRSTMERIFKHAVDKTFNAVSVDGCMSTNDTAVFMASGAAGNRSIKINSSDCQRFREVLTDVLGDLARLMVKDGEGATKVIEITVEEAASLRDAKRVAKAVANANLVKAAFFGEDPNWGRIVSAAGSLGIGIPVQRFELSIGEKVVFKNGRGVEVDRKLLEEVVKTPEIKVRLKLGMGKSSWRVWASDLTYEYVRINAHYTT